MGGVEGRDDGKSSTIGSEGFENERLFESMSGNAGAENKCGLETSRKEEYSTLRCLLYFAG